MTFRLNDTDKRAYSLIRKRLIIGDPKPTLKEINEVTGGRSPRSAVLVIERLVKNGLLKWEDKILRLSANSFFNPESIETIRVPLIGTVTCGMPMMAEENIETYIPVSTQLAKKGSNYFLLRAIGDSMNLAGINHKDILLIKQQNTAIKGDKVVALINDEATVKVFDLTLSNDGAISAIILRPKSSNNIYKPIVISENCQIQGVVVAILPPDII